MDKTERKKYVPKDLSQKAYYNKPLSIGYGVTISQPSLAAQMIDELEVDSINILELGKGYAYTQHFIQFGSIWTSNHGRTSWKIGNKSKKILNKRVTVVKADALSTNFKHKFDRIIV